MKIDISTWKNLTRNFREADYLPQNRARINTAYRYQQFEENTDKDTSSSDDDNDTG